LGSTGIKKISVSPEKREIKIKGDGLNEFDYYNPKNL
jgi:hypothetical protein